MVHFPAVRAMVTPACSSSKDAMKIAASATGWERSVRGWGCASPHPVCAPSPSPSTLHKVPSDIFLQDRSLLSPVHGHFPTAAHFVRCQAVGRRGSGKPPGCMLQQIYGPAPAPPAYQNMPSSLLRLMSLFIWQTEHTGHHKVIQ